MKKARFLALFLCLVMLLGVLPPQTQAANQITLVTSEDVPTSNYMREQEDAEDAAKMNAILSALKSGKWLRRRFHGQTVRFD